MRKNYRLLRKNQREKEQEGSSGEEDNNSATRNEPKLDKVKNNVKFEEGEPTMRRNK